MVEDAFTSASQQRPAMSGSQKGATDDVAGSVSGCDSELSLGLGELGPSSPSVGRLGDNTGLKVPDF